MIKSDIIFFLFLLSTIFLLSTLNDQSVGIFINYKNMKRYLLTTNDDEEVVGSLNIESYQWKMDIDISLNTSGIANYNSNPLIHKNLFPLQQSDILGTVFIFLGTLIAAAGGIGGGGIFVPVLILVYGFQPKYAIPLSNFCIVGSSITQIILNLFKRHPIADRPLVDWDLVLVMEPLTLAGAVVGAFVSIILPDWMLVLSLALLLAFTTWTTLEKGMSQFRKETIAFEVERRRGSSLLTETLKNMEESDEQQSFLSEEGGDFTKKESNSIDENIELSMLLKEEENTSFEKVAFVTVMVVVVIVLNLLRGGSSSSGFPSPLGFSCGSFGYWFLTLIVFVWVIGLSYYVRTITITKYKLKKRLRYKYVDGDIEWNEINTIICPCICFFAGFFKMFGVGGGIVKGPLMLHMV